MLIRVMVWHRHLVPLLIVLSLVLVIICLHIIVIGLIIIVIIVGLIIRLSKLVQDRPRPFGINCRYLSHHLPIISMRTVLKLLLPLSTWFHRAVLAGTGNSFGSFLRVVDL